jgi:hypothetical protein
MKFTKILFLVITAIILIAGSTDAQDINWFSNLSINTYPSPYFDDWERDPSLGSLFLRYQGAEPAEYYFQATIVSNIEGEISINT